MTRGLLKYIVPGFIAVALPFVLPGYYLHMLILVLLWVTLATAWNLLGGYAGQVSFGHALFFGLGAYGGGLLFYYFGISTWWGMLVGPIWAVIVAIPIGLITFRLRGPYFALAMLAMAEVARIIFNSWTSFSNGAVGIMISRTWGGDKLPYYAIILAIAVLALYVTRRLVRSKFGYYFLSIREDQDAAEALGIPSTRYKLYALIPSVFLTALAGAFYMNYMAFIQPEVVFNLTDISIMMILCVMLGGAGTEWGPALGAAVYVLLAECFRTVPVIKEVHLLAFAIIIIAIIMFLPDGIIGSWDKVSRCFAGPKAAGPPAAGQSEAGPAVPQGGNKPEAEL
ncbi:MAG: branched-chain amino acid ABC transporter permease [Desulfobaccales bacterium]